MPRRPAAVYLTDGPRFPHGIHLVLTVCSCGLWLPLWMGLYFQWKLSGGAG